MKIIKNIFLLILLTFFTYPAYSEMSVEEIIKGRQAIFSENYKTAKRVQALSSDIEFEVAIELMNKMSENYKTLLDYFPENSKDGFDTEALPTIWENKDEFNALMQKASDDMLTLASVIEDADDIRAILTKHMWSNCKACHSRFREEH